MKSTTGRHGKSWRARLAGYPHLPEVKPIPERMQARFGTGSITPYWRTLKGNGELNLKYPGGLDELMCRLESKGHTVVQRGRHYFIEDFEKKLIGR